MALRLSEGLGTRGHMLKQVDVCGLVPKLGIQLACSVVAAEYVQRHTKQTDGLDLDLERLEGPPRMALATMLWCNHDVVDVRDWKTKLGALGEP